MVYPLKIKNKMNTNDRIYHPSWNTEYDSNGYTIIDTVIRMHFNSHYIPRIDTNILNGCIVLFNINDESFESDDEEYSESSSFE